MKSISTIILAVATAACLGLVHAAASRHEQVVDVDVPPPVKYGDPEPPAPAPAPRTPQAERCHDALVGGGLSPARATEICAELATEAPTTMTSAQCGGDRVVEALESVHLCARANSYCDMSSGQRVTVDVENLLLASTRFPVFTIYFDNGRAEVPDPAALAAFVAGASGGDIDFVVIGSASPNAARAEVDHYIAGQRAYRTREALYRALRATAHKRGNGRMPAVHQANVGRALPADYCQRLDDAAAGECAARDTMARRQVAIVIAYPRACAAARAPSGGS